MPKSAGDRPFVSSSAGPVGQIGAIIAAIAATIADATAGRRILLITRSKCRPLIPAPTLWGSNTRCSGLTWAARVLVGRG